MAIGIGQLQGPAGADQLGLLTKLDNPWGDQSPAIGFGLCMDLLQVGDPQAQLPMGQILDALVRGHGASTLRFAVVEALDAGARGAAMAGDVYPAARDAIEAILLRPGVDAVTTGGQAQQLSVETAAGGGVGDADGAVVDAQDRSRSISMPTGLAFV